MHSTKITRLQDSFTFRTEAILAINQKPATLLLMLEQSEYNKFKI